MARDDAPPFNRGETWYGGSAIDSNDLGGVNLEGKEYVFEDTIRGTQNPVRVRVVRNKAADVLLPKRLVRFQAGSFYGRRVDGYTSTTAEEGFPVDELLPSTGVPVNDLFYIVVNGPALVLSDLAGGANNVITTSNNLVALTAATSGATTAGRVAAQDLTGATAVLANQIQNRIGRALTAATTANTNTDILTYVRW